MCDGTVILVIVLTGKADTMFIAWVKYQIPICSLHELSTFHARPLTGILPGRLRSIHQLMPYKHYQVWGWHSSMGCPSDEDSRFCESKWCSVQGKDWTYHTWYWSRWHTLLKFYITRLLLSRSSPSVCNSFASSWLIMAQSSGASKLLYVSICFTISPASLLVSSNVILEPRSGIRNYPAIASTIRLTFLRPVSSTWCQTF